MCIDDIHQTRGLGICVQVNKAFTRLFGYNLKETHRLKDWFRRAFPEPGYRKEIIRGWLRDIRRAQRQGGVLPLSEDRITTKNGQVVMVEVGGDRKSTRLNSSHEWISRMPSSA